MTARLSSRLVSVSLLDAQICVENIRYVSPIIVETDILQCKKYGKTQEACLYVPQSADIKYQFVDNDTAVDFSTVTAAVFRVWDSVSSTSTQRITKSIGSGIVIAADNKINVNLSNSDTSIAPNTYRFELWVETSSGNILLKYGKFVVEDTRNYDS